MNAKSNNSLPKTTILSNAAPASLPPRSRHTRFSPPSVWNPVLLAVGLVGLSITGNGAETTPPLPDADQRASFTRDLNTPWKFPEIAIRSDWESRAKEIRENTLISCGLWPIPEKEPLQAKVLGSIVHEDYQVQRVYFQTYPGVYLAGNLYRPVGKGNGPFPAVLNPHGHGEKGRLADEKNGSIAARCISFARQGMVAFSYDMVGYNDTAQFKHRAFATDPTNQLWNISLMGLQTWNSIRALDFLISLEDVKKSRIACTGESGGGTQTFMLGAVDDRLEAQAPVVMVSHSMQGGCLCENAPGLRVNHSNMEIAAVPAPRPQILVAATGDWTKTTMSLEGPAIEHIYQLFDHPDRFRYVRFDFGHNYNLTSREAVYAWFGQWLLKHPSPDSLKEQPYQKEPDAALRVWPDGKMPDDALSETAFITAQIGRYQAQLDRLKPSGYWSFVQYRTNLAPVWRHNLQLENPDRAQLRITTNRVYKTDQFTVSWLAFGRAGKGDRLPAVLLRPTKKSSHGTVILADPAGKSAFLANYNTPKGLALLLVERGFSVLMPDLFLTGELAKPEWLKSHNYFANLYTTYNRTMIQQRVQDLVTTCKLARRPNSTERVILCGTQRAGLWALLAAPAADAVVADVDGLDSTNDQLLLAPDLFAPGLRRMGGFEGAAMLAAPNPLFLHRTGLNFSTTWLRDLYDGLRAASHLEIAKDVRDDERIADWIQNVAARAMPSAPVKF